MWPSVVWYWRDAVITKKHLQNTNMWQL